MNSSAIKYRFLIGAGGTGGHLYPALAVADKIKELLPESEFLFVGSKDKIESRVVPAKGYNFKSILISGFARKMNLKNLMFPFKMLAGFTQALGIAIKFKPHVVIGAGSYVSGPVVWAGTFMGAKALLLEQNSYPGITNRLLEKKAAEIFISFEESKEFFREREKLTLTGNPVRPDFKPIDKKEAREKLGLAENGKYIFIVGGSLGARSINEAVAENLEKFSSSGIKILWQTGKNYFDEYKNLSSKDVRVIDFIDDVALYYSAADLIVARAGATTIAELSYLGLPAVLIPSPNVAADHQYRNAEALRKVGAAELIKDNEAAEKLFVAVGELLNDENKLEKLSENIKKFAKHDAAEVIAGKAIDYATRL